jgi:hypothetical protein
MGINTNKNLFFYPPNGLSNTIFPTLFAFGLIIINY